MSLDNTHKELLRKLVDGTISKQEKWQLERASLDDPFLADALEGYYDNKEETHQLDILEKRLAPPKEKQRKIIPMRWLSVAASLLILLGASFWLFQQTDTAHDLAKVTAHETDHVAKTATDQINELSSEDTIVTNDLLNPNKGAQVDKTAPTSAPLMTQVPIKSSTKVIDRVVAKNDDLENLEEEQADMVEEEALIIEEEKVGDNTQWQASDETDTSPNQEKRAASAAVDEVVLESTKKPLPPYKNKSTNSYKTVESKVKKEEEMMIPNVDRRAYLNSAPTEAIPIIIQGVITDETGMPISGVQLVDLKNNELATTDVLGNFVLPQTQGYVITAFAGYDSLTVALAPQLDIKLRPVSNTFSEPLKRKVDLMDDNELKVYYRDQLNSLFFKNWPLCRTGWDNSFNNNPGSIRVLLSIDTQGKLDEVLYYSELNDVCKDKISSILKEAEETIFKDERPVSFSIRINL